MSRVASTGQKDSALRALNLRNDELEAAIRGQPGEVGPRAVLADWLLERGDLRGQLIALQLAAVKKPASVGDQVDAFMKKHARALLGPLARCTHLPWSGGPSEERSFCRWSRGFIESARVIRGDDRMDSAEAIGALLQGAAGLVLGSLEVVDPDMPSIIAILAQQRPASLSTLSLRAVHTDEFARETEPHPIVGRIDSLWALPGLERLTVTGAGIEPGVIAHQRLEELRLWGDPRPSPQAVKSAVCARLPRCRVLSFGVGRRRIAPAHVTPLLKGTHLPVLTDLDISQALLDADFIDALASTPLLPRLSKLGLTGLSIAGAEALERHAASFAHLKGLDLSYPRFPREWLARLRDAGLSVGSTVTVSSSMDDIIVGLPD